MKLIQYCSAFLIALICLFNTNALAQTSDSSPKEDDAIIALIDQYAKARQMKDTSLLKEILTEDIDQLVSTGEWRRELPASLAGMLRSSVRNTGNRTLTVEHIRYPHPEVGIADTRYEIQNEDGSARKMWSTFVVLRTSDGWKITAIRNMLPAKRKK